MNLKKLGDAIMVPKLDLVNDPSLWIETAMATLKGADQLHCPVCGQDGIRMTAACAADRVGFLALSCLSCGKAFIFREGFLQ